MMAGLLFVLDGLTMIPIKEDLCFLLCLTVFLSLLCLRFFDLCFALLLFLVFSVLVTLFLLEVGVMSNVIVFVILAFVAGFFFYVGGGKK